MGWNVGHAGVTHVGMKRAHNEDNFFLLPDERLFIVADGMGGHASGEVASQIAVETLANFFIDSGRDQDITWPYRENHKLNYSENRLLTGIKLANRRVYETAQSDTRYRGMGTTLVTLSVGEDDAYLAHVGDSRAYLLRDGKITQLTEDHSLLNDYLKIHKLSAEEIQNFPHKNVIVRALGMKETVEPELTKISPQEGDLYLLCTDGLSGMLDDTTILEIASGRQSDLNAMCETLISEANEAGGNDNVTAAAILFE